MELFAFKSRRLRLKIALSLFSAIFAFGQQMPDGPPVPPNFKLDLETALRLRPQFMAQSTVPSGHFATGKLVFERLIKQVQLFPEPGFSWELRIVDDGQLNAYSSPDGAIYVESGLAQLAGQSPGLWAAILSHEIAHIVRRDWARRYLYQESLETKGATAIVLGDPGLPSTSWTDSRKASENLGRFCRQLEVDADREGLMLMARAGYHPDFMPALHHLLHAQDSGPAPASLYAMHPCWEERDRELIQAYVRASIEFEHRWLEWYASPGGDPPIVVFVEAPAVRKTSSKEWLVQIPMRCENLIGGLEVVLRVASASAHLEHSPGPASSGSELRQVTGCTSPRTLITFTLQASERSKPGTHWADLYVLDPGGAILARSDVPKLPH